MKVFHPQNQTEGIVPKKLVKAAKVIGVYPAATQIRVKASNTNSQARQSVRRSVRPAPAAKPNADASNKAAGANESDYDKIPAPFYVKLTEDNVQEEPDDLDAKEGDIVYVI